MSMHSKVRNSNRSKTRVSVSVDTSEETFANHRRKSKPSDLSVVTPVTQTEPVLEMSAADPKWKKVFISYDFPVCLIKQQTGGRKLAPYLICLSPKDGQGHSILFEIKEDVSEIFDPFPFTQISLRRAAHVSLFHLFPQQSDMLEYTIHKKSKHGHKTTDCRPVLTRGPSSDDFVVRVCKDQHALEQRLSQIVDGVQSVKSYFLGKFSEPKSATQTAPIKVEAKGKHGHLTEDRSKGEDACLSLRVYVANHKTLTTSSSDQSEPTVASILFEPFKKGSDKT